MEIKSVTISVIPHSAQRYNTVGDWLFEHPDELTINVSETGSWRWNMCVAVHELIEAIACTHNLVTQEQVDDFDTKWKPNFGFEEPGEDPKAPYYAQHGLASMIEANLFGYMGDEIPKEWNEYEAKLDELLKSRESVDDE